MIESDSPDFKPGQQVILTGWGGERFNGGLAEYARVKPNIGAAARRLGCTPGNGSGQWPGWTAMLCVMALSSMVTPDSGEVLCQLAPAAGLAVLRWLCWPISDIARWR